MFAHSNLLHSLCFNRGLLICRVNRAVAVGTALHASRFCFSVKEQAAETTSPRLIDAKTCDSSLTVRWQDGKARFHNIWLRHHCPCEQCLRPQTNEKLVDMALISEDIHPREVKTIDDKIHISWNDSHESVFKADWLKDNAYDEVYKIKSDKTEFRIVDGGDMMLWNRDTIASNPPPEFSFGELQKNDPDRDLEFRFLDTIVRYGLAFVNETPLDAESFGKIGKWLGGHVQETQFGRVFSLDTRGFTHVHLGYAFGALSAHTDQSYTSIPPGIQAMHCTYKEDDTGGVNLFVDGFLAAKTLHQEDPEAFNILTRTDAPFKYNGKNHCLRVHAPMIELDPVTGAVVHIRYNNMKVGIFNKLNLRYEEMPEFYHAVQAFGAILRRPEHEMWFQLSPGRVAVTDNRRILHGRSAITGVRELQGFYVALDDYIGRWRAMKKKRSEISL